MNVFAMPLLLAAHLLKNKTPKTTYYNETIQQCYEKMTVKKYWVLLIIIIFSMQCSVQHYC